LDLAGHTITGDKTGHIGIKLNGRTGVTVKGGTIENFEQGIWLLTSSNNIIKDNTIYMYTVGEGIWLDGSSDNIIEGNTISGSSTEGIGLSDSLGSYSGNIVRYNNLFSRTIGIRLWGGTANIIEGNTLSGSGNAIRVDTGYGRASSGNIITENICSGGYSAAIAAVNWRFPGEPWGIFSNIQVTYNDIINNKAGIYITGEIYAGVTYPVDATAFAVNYNNIFGNELYGAKNLGTGTLDARFNWWGDASGPYHPTLNPAGLGNNVSDNVNFNPWLGFVTFDQVGVGSDFTGTVLTVDGTGYGVGDLPKNFKWITGSTHTFAYGSPLVVSTDKQYVWASTAGLSTDQSGTITVPCINASVTGYYKTQYKITVTASPPEAVSGTFDVTYTKCGTLYNLVGQTTTWSDWADAGTAVTVSNPQDIINDGYGIRYKFDYYAPSSSVTMTDAKTITLVYKTQYCLTVISPYDTPGGMGWYDSGSTAYATLATGMVDITAKVRAVFTGWSGDASGTGLSASIYMDGPKTAVANWKIQYYLDVVTDPSTLPPIPGADWYDNCTWVRLTAPQYVPSEAGLNGVRYRFSYWDVDGASQGIGVNPIDIHMNAPHIATAYYVTQYLVTFIQTGLDGTAIGTVVTVDGSAKTYDDLPFSMWVDNGTSVSYNYESIVSSSDSGKRFRLNSVTDPASPITVTSPVTVTGNYVTQYHLTLATSPPGVNAPTGEDWYDAGTYAPISTAQYEDIVTGSSRYRFNGWTTGDISEITNPSLTSTTVYMDKAKTVTANYVTQYNITFDQTGVGSDFTGTVVVIDGADYGVSTLAVSFWYDSDSTHNFAFQSPLVVPPGAKQYVWNSTNGLSSLQSGSITVTGSGSVTGNYVTRVHDIAVTDVVADRTWVYQGHTASINVTVLNKGDFPETVTVILYYNITANKIIGTQIINLIPGESQTLIFVWDTTGVEYCHNYTLTAVATIIPPDNDPADNTFTDGKVKVRILGDTNGDGIVDIEDIYAAAIAYGSYPGHELWDPDMDLNSDGIIDIEDIYTIALYYGFAC